MSDILLFTQFPQRTLKLRNRVVVSPMCMYTSDDGFPADWHLVHLGSRAVGGAGVVLQEATAVERDGRITPHDAGMYLDEHIDAYARITRFVKMQGAAVGLQLAHAGRKASTARPWEGGGPLHNSRAWQVVGPSPVPFDDGYPTPVALDAQGLRRIVEAFRDATRRAYAAGYDIVEIHAAHGYLLHQFLSPLSNRRQDGYGGAFESRIRLLLEVVEAMRAEWPERLPLWVRVSATDWVEGGWLIDECVELAQRLKARGVDVIDVSSGGLSPNQRVPLAPGYQVPFASRIKREAQIATAAVGLITDAEQAEGILRRGEADLIVMARETLRDPYWPLHAAQRLGVDVPWPVQYERAKPVSGG